MAVSAGIDPGSKYIQINALREAIPAAASPYTALMQTVVFRIEKLSPAEVGQKGLPRRRNMDISCCRVGSAEELRVTKMTRSASTSWQQSQFDDFLHAPIGHEKNGMLLTVLSALARLDLDPWGEAANLAQLPTEAATERMRSLVAAADEPATASEAVAARLVALLPSRAISDPRPRKTNPRETLQRVGLPNNSRFFLFVAIVAILLSMQISMASRHSPAHPDPSPTAGFSGSSEAAPKP